MTVVPLPTDLPSGKVVGRFLLAKSDGPDADRTSDGYPATGTITFQSVNLRLKGESPTPTTVFPLIQRAQIDQDGYLVDEPGATGIWLLAGAYRVTYKFEEVSNVPGHTIVVTSAHTDADPLDLTNHLPPESPVLKSSQYGELNERMTRLEVDGGGILTQAAGSVTLPETYPTGSLLGYRVTSTATFDHSTGSITLAAGAYIFENLGNTWVYRTLAEASALTPPVPDTTAPTAGTLASSAISDTGFTLTVTGASDNKTLHSTPYAFSTDGGTTWSAWQTSPTYTVSGLTASTAYQVRHKVRDASGNTATGNTVSVTTLATPPGLPVNDTFTAADGTAIVGRTVSGFTWALDTNNDLNMTPAGGPVITSNTARTPSGVRAAVMDVGVTNVRVSASVSGQVGQSAGGARIGLGGSRTSGGNLNGLYVVIGVSDIKTYWDNGSGTIKQIGATHPSGVAPGETKVVSVEYNGTTVITKLDGATINSGAATLVGTKVGFGISYGATLAHTVDDFSVVAL